MNNFVGFVVELICGRVEDSFKYGNKLGGEVLDGRFV